MDNLSRYWEMGLNSCLVDPTLDTLYAYDVKQAKAMVERAPWKDKARYFKRVRISALALIKMVTHARSGGAFEVMGLMQGYLEDEAFVVTDAFRLPVEGTETRVNAHEAANEYMVQYLETGRNQGSRRENVVGWYHSHPGYGCWLSGIDVGTQQQQQMFNEPFVAVVIDPERTVNSAKVDIGAFRTLPAGYTDESAGPAATASGPGPVHRMATAATGRVMSSGAGWQAVPFDKTADFGAHAHRYYPLDVSIFRSSLDSTLLNRLWHKYWVQTLSQSPLTAGHAFSTRQIVDLSSRVKDASLQIKRTSRMNPNPGPVAGRAAGSALDQVVQDAKGLATRERTGLLAGNVRERIFGGPEEDGQAIAPARDIATAAAAPGSSAAPVLIADDGGQDDTPEQQPTTATATDTTEPEVAPAGGAEGGPQ